MDFVVTTTSILLLRGSFPFSGVGASMQQWEALRARPRVKQEQLKARYAISLGAAGLMLSLPMFVIGESAKGELWLVMGLFLKLTQIGFTLKSPIVGVNKDAPEISGCDAGFGSQAHSSNPSMTNAIAEKLRALCSVGKICGKVLLWYMGTQSITSHIISLNIIV